DEFGFHRIVVHGVPRLARLSVLVGDGDPEPSERAGAAGPLAALAESAHRALHSTRGVVAGLGRDGDLDAGERAAVAGAEVEGTAVDADDLDLPRVCEVDQFLKLLGLPVQAVDVGHDDAPDLAGPDLGQHPAVVRPALARVGGRA